MGRRIQWRFDADVAQLVEHHLAKVRVAGSNLVVRSTGTPCSAGGSSVFAGSNWTTFSFLGRSEAAGTWRRPLLVAVVALFELVVVAVRVVGAFVVVVFVDEDAFFACH